MLGWYLTSALQLRHSTVPAIRQMQCEKKTVGYNEKCMVGTQTIRIYTHTQPHTCTQPSEIDHRSPSQSKGTSYRCFYEDKRERRSQRDIKAAFPLQRFAALQVYVGNHQRRGFDAMPTFRHDIDPVGGLPPSLICLGWRVTAVERETTITLHLTRLARRRSSTVNRADHCATTNCIP